MYNVTDTESVEWTVIIIPEDEMQIGTYKFPPDTKLSVVKNTWMEDFDLDGDCTFLSLDKNIRYDNSSTLSMIGETVPESLILNLRVEFFNEPRPVSTLVVYHYDRCRDIEVTSKRRLYQIPYFLPREPLAFEYNGLPINMLETVKESGMKNEAVIYSTPFNVAVVLSHGETKAFQLPLDSLVLHLKEKVNVYETQDFSLLYEGRKLLLQEKIREINKVVRVCRSTTVVHLDKQHVIWKKFTKVTSSLDSSPRLSFQGMLCGEESETEEFYFDGSLRCINETEQDVQLTMTESSEKGLFEKSTFKSDTHLETEKIIQCIKSYLTHLRRLRGNKSGAKYSRETFRILKDDISSAGLDYIKVARWVKELNEKFCKLENKSRNMNVTNRSLNEKIAVSNERNESLKTLIAKMKKENEILKSQISKSDQDLETLNAKNKHLETTIETLTTRTVKIIEEGETLKNEIAKMGEEVETWKAKNIETEKEVEDLLTKNTEQAEEVENLKIDERRLEETVETLKNEIAKMGEEIETWKAKNIETEKEVEDLKTDKRGLEDTVETLKNEIAKMNEEIEIWKNNNADLKSEIDALTANKKNIENTIDEIIDEKIRFKTEAGNLKAENTELEEQVKLLRVYTTELVGENQSLNVVVINLEQDVQSLNGRIMNLMSDNQQLKLTQPPGIPYSPQEDSGVELLVFCSLFSPIANQSEIQHRGQYHWSDPYIKCKTKRLIAGWMTFEDVRDSLQSLFINPTGEGKIFSINQWRGTINDTGVAEVTSAIGDTWEREDKQRQFCSSDGQQFSWVDVEPNENLIRTGDVLICGGNRRTVLWINPY